MPIWKPILEAKPSGGKSKALAEAISRAIEAGELTLGEKLPPQRELAHELNLSFQTVSNAYRELQNAGIIRSVVGRGSFVNARGSSGSGNFILTPGPEHQLDLSVTELVHDPELHAALRETMIALGRERHSPWMDQLRPVAGNRAHLEAGLSWLEPMNTYATYDRLFVVNGATHGIFLALSAVVKPGDTVLTESLTENGIIGAANILGASLRGVATDEEGIIPDALDEACLRYKNIAALVWVPTLGNPTAHMAGARRREAIAEIIARHDIAIIEDEVHRPIVETKLLAASGLLPRNGFFTTSFTKCVMTGLRVGYLLVPARYTYRVASAMRSTTWSCPPLMSEVASRWIKEGLIAMSVQRRREEIGKRQALVEQLLKGHLRGFHALAPYAWLTIPAGWTEATLSAELQQANILVSTSAPFAIDPDAEPGIRISVSGVPNREKLAKALTVIRDVFDKLPI